MNLPRKLLIGGAMAAATLTGRALGASLLGPAGADTSNNTAAHEAGESAQREADETAGKVGGGHSNTDPAHEAAESPARAAQEAANDAAAGSSSATAPSTSTTPAG